MMQELLLLLTGKGLLQKSPNMVDGTRKAVECSRAPDDSLLAPPGQGGNLDGKAHALREWNRRDKAEAVPADIDERRLLRQHRESFLFSRLQVYGQSYRNPPRTTLLANNRRGLLDVPDASVKRRIAAKGSREAVGAVLQRGGAAQA